MPDTKLPFKDFKPNFLTLSDTNPDAKGRKVRLNAASMANYYPSQAGDGTTVVNMHNGDSFVVAESAEIIDQLLA
jgi:hypothetical protein